MLTTKNEREDGKYGNKFSPFFILAFLALAVALAGCGPAGSHALMKGKKLLDQGDYADAADEFRTASEVMTTNAEVWNYLGVADQHAGQYEEAANAYQRALELNRDLTEAHHNLGCLYLDQNKPDEAVSEFTAYTLRKANEPEGWLKLGMAQLRVKDVLPAEKSFSTALYLSPNNAEALNGLGLARMQRGLPDEAEKFFQAAVQNHPDYGPAILNWATVEHENLHNDRLALDEYHAYLALNPRPANWDDVNALANSLEQTPTLAMTQTPVIQQTPRERQNSAPVESTEQTFRRPPPPPAAPPKPPRVHPPIQHEPTETVEVQPEETIAPAQNSTPRPEGQPATPASNAGYYNQYHWYHPQPAPETGGMRVTPLPPENYSGTPAPVHIVQPAPPTFPRYLYLSPRKPAPGDRRAASALFAQARQDEAQRRFTDALDCYRRATRLDPGWFEAQYNCGVMAYRLRDYQFSLAAYEMALAINPDSVDARYNFALTLKAAGYVTDAVEELKRTLASNPNDARAHLELGNIYAQQLRDVPRARTEYIRVLQLDPANPQASNIEFWLSANPP